MVLIHTRRATGALIVVSGLALTLSACGGTGSTAPIGTPTLTPRRPTPTRSGIATFTQTPTITKTPTQTPTPTSTFVPLECFTPRTSGCVPDVVGTIRSAGPGSTITLPGGPYDPIVLRAEDVHGPITLMADLTALVGGGTAAPAIVDARGGIAAITLIGVADLVIDGFTITGGSIAAIRVQDSVGVTIRNSIVRGSSRDGIRFERSSNSLVFNNLVYDQHGAGINIVGATDLQIINNTVFGNDGGGVIIGDSSLPSAQISLQNNIINMNAVRGIIVAASTTDYSGNYNLNTDGYGPGVTRGSRDINTDPLFANPTKDDGFHVAPTDDDCIGGSPTIDAGNPDTDGALIDMVIERTTQTDERFDCIGFGCCPVDCDDAETPCTRQGQLDLGYHYLTRDAFIPPTVPRAPTRTPRAATPVEASPTVGEELPTVPPEEPTIPEGPTPTEEPAPPTNTPRRINTPRPPHTPVGG